MEKTLVLLKPDALQRNLVGECIKRLESEGLRLLGMKLVKVKREEAEELYREHEGKEFYQGLIDFTLSGPCVALVLEGESAVSRVRKLVGATNPQNAEKGTIRGDFGGGLPNNIVHAADSVKSAEREIAIFFAEHELLEWERGKTT